MKKFLSALLLIFGIFSLANSSQTFHPAKSLAITNVTIIDGINSTPKKKMTVLIKNGRIKTIKRTGKVKIPPKTKTINGTGKFLIPGLWDMHVHVLYKGFPEKAFPMLIANGVTSVRDLNGTIELSEVNKIKKQISTGEILGPRMFVAGKLIDGPRPANALGPFVISVKNKQEARQAVRTLKGQGADFIKIYNRITPELFEAIADESKKQKITFVGHTPHLLRAEDVSNAGQKSIEHLTGVLEGAASSEKNLIEVTKNILIKEKPTPIDFLKVIEARKKILADYDEEKAQKLFRLFAKNATWHTPTFASYKVISTAADDDFLLKHPLLKYVSTETEKQWMVNSTGRKLRYDIMKERFPKLLEIVGKMKRANVRFLAGTDVGVPYVFPGFSLHDELDFFVKAGFTPFEALQTATRNPAEFMDKLDSLGTVEKGKIADLILLNANPLEDIKNTRKIHGVIKNGLFLDKTKLEKLLFDVRRKNVEP